MLEYEYEIEQDYDLESEEQGNILATRMSNFRQHLGQKLEQMGLQLNLSSPKNKDPQLRVQQQIEQLTSLLIQKTQQVIEDHLNLTQLVHQNQSLMIKYYTGVLSLGEVMIQFSENLYNSGQQISTFRSFRKLTDQFAQYSVLMNNYYAFTSDFEQKTKQFAVKQQDILQKIIFKDEQIQVPTFKQNTQSQIDKLREQNQQLLQVLRKYEQELSKYEIFQGQQQNNMNKESNSRLVEQIDRLQRALNQNNQDFIVQVKRYNDLLYSQRQSFKDREAQLSNQIRVMQYSLRQVEKQLSFSKQQRYKDQLMIENLIRKARHLEKKKDSFNITQPSQLSNMTIPISPKRITPLSPINISFKKK